MARLAREPWDALVIGAGPAGIYAWQALRAQGRSVLLVEASGPAPRDASGPPEQAPPAWRYRCEGPRESIWLRAHGVGGRSALWGAWTTRFSDDVFARWPHGADELRPHILRAGAFLGVRRQVLSAPFARLSELGLPLFACRSAADSGSPWARAREAARESARVCTPVLRLDVALGRVQAAIVRAADGREQAIPARSFVLAASPVESCRILMASGAQHPALGAHLTDHIGLFTRLIEPPGATPLDARGALVRVTGRARAGAAVRLAGGYTGSFLVELVGPMPVTDELAALLREGGLACEPGSRITSIQAMGEQAPRAGQRLSLDPDVRDALGRALPRIELRTSDEDRAMLADMRRVCEAVATRLAGGGARLLELGDTLSDVARVFHPSGTVVMGRGDDAPSTPAGQLREWPNVYLADASVFPTSGDAHPTLTVLAHVDRMLARGLS